MPRFTYKARDEIGHVQTGETNANSVDAVMDFLEEKGLFPVSIDELNFDGSRKDETFVDKIKTGLHKMQTKVPYKDVVFFTRQLATMISAGVPLAQALGQLAENQKPVFKKIIEEVETDISKGSTFSDALGKHPGAFSNMFVSVIRSGEVTGALDTVLDQMATYMENIEALKQKVKGAMRYPLFIAGFVTVMVIGILWKLVPVFANMYASFGAELPRPTQILVTASDIIQHHFLIVLGVLIAIVVLFKALMTNDGFKRIVHRGVFYIPVFGPILRKNILATFCRTMALLMEAGTPILQAIEIGGAVVGNKIYADTLMDVHQKLTRGDLLSKALRDSGEFPVLVTQLVSTGESAGRLDELLRKAAEFYEREIRVTVDSLATIIEPFLIIILGSIVGSILIALYYPIFTLGEVIG